MYLGLTCLCRGQDVAARTRWLGNHWRAAKVICLSFAGYPKDGDWAASQPAPGSPAGAARVLRVKCSGTRQGWLQVRPLTGSDALVGLPRWVAGVLPLCQSLTALHLARVELKELPALPLLVYLILEECEFQPALVASLQGLAMLETLHVSGGWEHMDHPVWDVRACTRLRRLCMGVLPGVRAG